jgi:hypothetical protein
MLAASTVRADEAATATGAAEPPPPPTLMYFSGADIWREGAFVHAGLLWSPKGLFEEGFTLKLLGGAGDYKYFAGALGTDVTGVNVLGSLMPGWRFKIAGAEITAYAGIDAQEHYLFPDDLTNKLRGFHAGVRAGADLWYEVLPQTMMIAANASVSTIGPGYWIRLATGWRVFDRLWVGPEVLALGDPTYRQFRIGIHGASFRMLNYEWSASVGFVDDSSNRSGVYASLGILLRR